MVLSPGEGPWENPHTCSRLWHILQTSATPEAPWPLSSLSMSCTQVTMARPGVGRTQARTQGLDTEEDRTQDCEGGSRPWEHLEVSLPHETESQRPRPRHQPVSEERLSTVGRPRDLSRVRPQVSSHAPHEDRDRQICAPSHKHISRGIGVEVWGYHPDQIRPQIS